ncbi:MAM and LDL-receptor class A domain-containing protein 2-like, partial [Dendronephthya gigantea]|uniref:MAM and LDL-receptor class A domain-containing protein 2-like n=1 Tax=Dendronephthya gigantea TaxID=151771 RepID=UPI00106BE2D6
KPALLLTNKEKIETIQEDWTQSRPHYRLRYHSFLPQRRPTQIRNTGSNQDHTTGTVNGVGFSEWSSFSPCSKDCVKKRQRYCFSSNHADCPGASSHGVESQWQNCANEECYAPVAGHWGRWSSWTECDENCKRHRSRKCSDPAPMHGGKDCPGVAKEEKDCYANSTCNPDNCDFTRGSYCHWTRYKNMDYFWQAHKGSTPTGSTGPNQDHTTGTGHYIFTEASFPAKENDTTLLTSKLFPPSQCRCISWYYYMYGRSMGELSVYIKDPVGSKRIIWDKKGDQGNRWILGSATISNVSTTSYQVEFEAIRGRSFYSDMALDDIHFTEMPCGIQHLGCFNDRYKRALPDLIANLRDKIDWYDMQKTVRECACVAYDKGYKYFAVQFYGECWGARSLIEYDKYGASNDCWSGVGKDFTNYVYKFTK